MSWVKAIEQEIADIVNPGNRMVIREHLGFLGRYCWPRGFGTPGSIRLEVVIASYMRADEEWEDRLVIVEATGTRRWFVEETMFDRDREAFLSLCRRALAEDLSLIG